jgi:hypothetical protein
MRLVARCHAIVVVLLLALSAFAEMSVTLKKSFLDTYKDRATIDVNLTVDAAHEHPNTGAKDGDMHVAGHASEVGLPMVAELMNAKERDDAQDLIHAAEANGSELDLSGVWRIWWEHPQSGANQTQLANNTLHGRYPTNPDHAFEIHPITDVANLDVRDTFHKISGYTPSSASTAFHHYESRTCTVVPGSNAVTITTSRALHNYARFKLELTSDAVTMTDGRWYYANVYTLTGSSPLAEDIPVVFVKNSPPETTVKSKHIGDRLNVVGIPRLNLRLIDYIVDHFQPGEEADEWYLPYEMVIVAVY